MYERNFCHIHNMAEPRNLSRFRCRLHIAHFYISAFTHEENPTERRQNQTYILTHSNSFLLTPTQLIRSLNFTLKLAANNAVPPPYCQREEM